MKTMRDASQFCRRSKKLTGAARNLLVVFRTPLEKSAVPQKPSRCLGSGTAAATLAEKRTSPKLTVRINARKAHAYIHTFFEPPKPREKRREQILLLTLSFLYLFCLPV
jgi:hypothetical protein